VRWATVRAVTTSFSTFPATTFARLVQQVNNHVELMFKGIDPLFQIVLPTG
jgi:hypothetical protein